MSWSSIQRITLPDGSAGCRKTTTYDARLEADGLRALAAAGAPVPAVREATRTELVMDWVEGRPDWESLGRAVAAVHRHTAEGFGYDTDNVLGPLPQPNGWMDDWGGFFVERRIRPHLEVLPRELRRRLEAACEGPLPELVDHQPAPSLVHGDLWAGNVVDGAWLIDPAVSYSDREVELAFAALFGGIPDPWWAAYAEAWPLDDGWQQRRPALQLYHLLVHVRLFGGGYTRMVADRLDRLGW